jgi:hypothetical protein
MGHARPSRRKEGAAWKSKPSWYIVGRNAGLISASISSVCCPISFSSFQDRTLQKNLRFFLMRPVQDAGHPRLHEHRENCPILRRRWQGRRRFQIQIAPVHSLYNMYGQATARSWRAQAASRRTLFRILPDPLFGSSVSENWMLRGTLKLARDRRQYAINSSAVSVFPGLRTT